VSESVLPRCNLTRTVSKNTRPPSKDIPDTRNGLALLLHSLMMNATLSTVSVPLMIASKVPSTM
jgi:hypothetical protein